MNEYKIGDKIIVLGGDGWCDGAKADIGSKGIIVGMWLGCDDDYKVYVPTSKTWSCGDGNGGVFTWSFQGKEMKKAGEEQLVFDWFKEE